MNLIQSHHPVRHVKSVKHAFDGILHALLNEPNFRVEAVIVLVSIAIGIYYKITNIEWAILVMSLGALLTAELVNTVMEELMDHFFKETNVVAKIIKDLAAGFVLISLFSTLFILWLLFGQRII